MRTSYYIPETDQHFKPHLGSLAKAWGLSESATLRALVHDAFLKLMLEQRGATR